MSGSPQTRVFILCPAALYREAWRALLSARPGISVLGAAGDVPGLAGLSPPDGAETVLVDVPHPHPELARRLAGLRPGAGLLFVVGSYEPVGIVALLGAGAAGCVSRDATVAELARSVIAAGRGEIALPPRVAAEALAALARGGTVSTGPSEPLSGRETEVLGLLARGLTNKGIAQTLFISVRTVEAHLRSVFAKLGVSSRTEAALWAVERGYGTED